MKRLNEIKIAIAASVVMGPLCGWLTPKIINFLDDYESTAPTEGAITCPASADIVDQLDPFIDAPSIGITDSGTICEFR